MAKIYKNSKTKLKISKDKTLAFVRKRPISIFITLLIVLFVIIAAGKLIRQPEKDAPAKEVAREIDTYQASETPFITVQAKVENTGVQNIISQTAGIMDEIRVKEGQVIKAGTILAHIATNYSGANILSTQRAIAASSYNNAKGTYDLNKEVIEKQRELAEKSSENSEELRSIADGSLADTRSLVDLNYDILNQLKSNLADLEANNPGGINDSAILGLKQQIAGQSAALLQLETGLKNTELVADENKPPSQLTQITKDLTLKQLSLQESGLELSLEISRLSLVAAQIAESLAYPRTPTNGVVERIHVGVGDSIGPGMALFTINSTSSEGIKLLALVPQSFAQKIDATRASTIHYGNKSLEAIPNYVSSVPTEGLSYSVIYTLNEESSNFKKGSFVAVDIPISQIDSTDDKLLIPIGAIHQTQDATFVYVVEQGRASARNVVVGQITGSFAEILSGLSTSDKVIISRNVIDGDLVTAS